MSAPTDPVLLGQTLGAAIVVGFTCVAAIRQGLTRWKRGQDASQHQEKQAMRSTVRRELAKSLGPMCLRLEALERAVQGRPSSIPAAARTARPRAARKARPG